MQNALRQNHPHKLSSHTHPPRPGVKAHQWPHPSAVHQLPTVVPDLFQARPLLGGRDAGQSNWVPGLVLKMRNGGEELLRARLDLQCCDSRATAGSKISLRICIEATNKYINSCRNKRQQNIHQFLSSSCCCTRCPAGLNNNRVSCCFLDHWRV